MAATTSVSVPPTAEPVSVALAAVLSSDHSTSPASSGPRWALVRALVPTAGSLGRFDEARRWAERADSALRRGDWSGFGRAFDALKQVLEAGPEGPK